MKFKFDNNQQYQLDAIQSITDLFNGIPKQGVGAFTVLENSTIGATSNISEEATLDYDLIAENMEDIQLDNLDNKNIQLDISPDLVLDHGIKLKDVSNDNWEYPVFRIEMETGTGKTYVYLRTIFELNQKYGFTKYIIVVPSVAIRIGVEESFRSLKENFSSLYNNKNASCFQFKSEKISQLRTFANSPDIQVMIMTLAAFNKKSNNLYKPTEKLQGEYLPYEYIQVTRPILILDEPQNMESELSKQALRTLNPLFGLAYSATHKTKHNMMYRLTPIEAFNQDLVKRIQVIGVSKEDDLNQPLLELTELKQGSIPSKHTAKFKAYSYKDGEKKTITVTLKSKDDLFKKTKWEHYKSGFKVEEINLVPDNEYVRFSNGMLFTYKTDYGVSKQEMFRWQIQQTIKAHFEKQKKLKSKGIKVLSLFFIDKVANYTGDDPIIKNIFKEEFDKLKSKYLHFKNLTADEVQVSYFASYRSGKGDAQKTVYLNDQASNIKEKKAEKEMFELIMKKKYKLLSFDEDRSFIFAHSALKEGWDNPNVFQICTLKQTGTIIRKRQELGRGLRICRNDKGERIFGEETNVLTVIANESYESFADTLQKEYTADGEVAPPRPTPHKQPSKRNDEIFNSEDFQVFWQQLTRRTDYKIKINEKELIKKCVDRINNTAIPDPKLAITKGNFLLTKYTFTLLEIDSDTATIQLEKFSGSKTKQTQLSINEEDITTITLSINDKSIENNFPNLRRFVVHSINPFTSVPYILFDSGHKLEKGTSLIIHTQEGQKRTPNVQAVNETLPVFNFIDRAAQETGLTKRTLLDIFKKSSAQKTTYKIFNNPEGFTSIFIGIIKNELANHVAKHIEFNISTKTTHYDINEIFPEEITYVQRETIEDKHGKSMYEHIQIDSNIERDFINHKILGKDKDKVVLYFKFPSKYRIHFPKIIHNYNPDWGIIIKTDTGHKLQLVRETKGTSDIDALRFPHEKRKIICATKHFDTIALDYDYIKGDENNWMQPRSTKPDKV